MRDQNAYCYAVHIPAFTQTEYYNSGVQLLLLYLVMKKTITVTLLILNSDIVSCKISECIICTHSCVFSHLIQTYNVSLVNSLQILL